MTRLLTLAQVRLADAYEALRHDEGQGMTEYAILLVGIIALVGVAVALITTYVTGLLSFG